MGKRLVEENGWEHYVYHADEWALQVYIIPVGEASTKKLSPCLADFDR